MSAPREVKHPHAKYRAARVLAYDAGWNVADIAAATASSQRQVERWLEGDAPRLNGRRGRPCDQCGARERRNNGLCSACTKTRHDAAVEMRRDGVRTDEIAAALGMAEGTVKVSLPIWERAA